MGLVWLVVCLWLPVRLVVRLRATQSRQMPDARLPLRGRRPMRRRARCLRRSVLRRHLLNPRGLPQRRPDVRFRRAVFPVCKPSRVLRPRHGFHLQRWKLRKLRFKCGLPIGGTARLRQREIHLPGLRFAFGLQRFDQFRQRHLCQRQNAGNPACGAWIEDGRLCAGQPLDSPG